MRSLFFMALMLAVGCGDDVAVPEPSLPRVMDVVLTPEEEYCNGDGFNPPGAWRWEGTLYAVQDDPDSDALRLHLVLEGWAFSFPGVHLDADGHFNAWSHYAFIRDGSVLAPLFNALEGDATDAGFEARFTQYGSDGDSNAAAVPDCRNVWLVKPR